MADNENRQAILLVDDTPVNLKLIRILLEAQGYEVRSAESAEEALVLLEAFHPALLLLDLQLPGMSGIELTAVLRGRSDTRELVIIAVTASAMKGDEEKALAAGFDGYITKPVDTRGLPGQVRKFLDSSPRRIAAASKLKRDEVLADLRERFSVEGVRESTRLLDSLETGFDYAAARRLMHQWVGVSSLLTHPDIFRLVSETQKLLDDPMPSQAPNLRRLLSDLAEAFARQRAS